ncbi:hypothetical protein I553_6045 [Mycobacterium xenopi 4042]|uniref:Acetyltransferase family protein n=1 Tax=Mycobacterium xenopi 4042 TaxID=1299334 RepID=X8BGJ4_MYCXE|nr:hypothetical protein I553_6045 [Mycobacterium xenopi 4042]
MPQGTDPGACRWTRRRNPFGAGANRRRRGRLVRRRRRNPEGRHGLRELAHGEVHVRIWIHPDYRHRGYGTAALAQSRPEMARYFPAVPLVIRAPGARPA